MKLPRRRFLQLAAGLAALPALPRIARAQAYPTRPVQLIVGTAAGGSTDIVARLMGQWLSERLSQQFVIVNRPGAGTNIATESVVNAAPDGHTLVVAGASSAINATLYNNLRFNFIRDIAPVASLIRVPNVIEVTLSLPVKSLPEFIAYAKANPGKVAMASPGAGTSPHLAGELFKMMAGVDMIHVPYRGTSPAHIDLLSGQVQVLFNVMVASVEFIRTGKVRGLAITAATRSETLPDLPTVSEFVPGYEASSWFGIGAPRNTPPAIIERLNKEINAGLANPKMKARLAELGSTPDIGSPADFGRLIAEETEKWGKVVKFAGLKPS